MSGKFLNSSVISCEGRFEAYKVGSLENPELKLGDIVKPVNAIIQQFSDNTTDVICPYFDEKEDFCTALNAASDTEESRQAINDRASFIVGSSLNSDDEKGNRRVSIDGSDQIHTSWTKCPYKKIKTP
ncbi:hypothetical protein C0416_01855 [bacterium]|nr:hypothetical protein [bacterium]